MRTVLTRHYTLPKPDQKEILRYAGVADKNSAPTALLEDCLREASDKLDCKVCFAEYPIRVCEDGLDLGFAKITSVSLTKALQNCHSVVIFAATIGASIDREIQKFSRLSPHRALALQREGTARIEAWCDALCAEFAKDHTCRKRFSPGYGDLDASVQREIFRVLEPAQKIGLCLGDSCVMSPSKSVTAFVGVEE